jgi:hypothetical protein
MKAFAWIGMALVAVTVAACGGGGGNPGSNTTGTGTGTGGGTPITSDTGGTQTSATASMAIDVLSGAGAPATSISTVEIAQARVTLKNASGSPVPGAVITFSESGGSLLTIAPISKTALTDGSGQATVEIRAANQTAVGATVVGAAANVAGTAITAQKAIAVTSSPASTGTAVNPQDLANAINFLDVNPADKSIVLAGAGGNGRSESATLRFRVVDKNNTPVKGVSVNFALVPAGDVTLNIPTALSDAEGVVLTTVSSKNVATAVVVQAVVSGKAISTQSDQLLVTTGLSTQAGFDLSASKFNLDADLSGDLSTINVRIVDVNGNPVADGVPVVFTTNFGAVGSSSRGGCTTSNGGCSVDYKVQDPRPADGQRIVVTASTQLGNGSSIGGSINLNATSVGNLDLYDRSTGALIGDEIVLTTCNSAFGYNLGTPLGFAAPAGTTVSVKSSLTGVTANVTTGSPVLDKAQSRTRINFEFNAAGAGCDPVAANNTTTKTIDLTFEFSVNQSKAQVFRTLTFPAK